MTQTIRSEVSQVELDLNVTSDDQALWYICNRLRADGMPVQIRDGEIEPTEGALTAGHNSQSMTHVFVWQQKPF